MILRYILLYLIIISGSIFISYKTNKKIEKCIAPNIAIIILVLYIFGMFEILKYGVWVIGILNIIARNICHSKNTKKYKRKYFNTRFYLFYHNIFHINANNI